MIQALFILLVLIADFSTALALAEPSANIVALVRQAQAKELANDPYWLALMHYRRTEADGNAGVLSEIISPDYFLSTQGSTDSSAELAATLAEFFKEPGKTPDSHAQCRFIARYKWLRKSLDWGAAQPPLVTCNQFDNWSLNGHIESLSLVFATGYLSNPASLYGHILLKFNTSRSISSTDLLDESINFGAIVPNNEVAVVYIFKGLFGGYDAGFSHDRFYSHNHMYAENELRDMWEYQLSLTADEVDQIVSHTWELLGNKFVYYFLKENCAYRMAELLGLVVEQPLLPPDSPWSIPAAVFNHLILLERNGTPIVRKIRRIPSRQNRFYDKFSTLTAAEKNLAAALSDRSPNFDQPSYLSLSETEKISIVDTLLEYYEFRIIGKGADSDLKQAKHKLLIERAGLASQKESAIENKPYASDIAPPHEGPLPSMVRLGIMHNSRFGTGMELRFRPAYYDFLELDAGHIANSNVTMFDFRTVYADGRLKLRSLDLVNIETLNISRTPLPGDGGLAWKVKFGFESQSNACMDCMTFNLIGGLGKAAQLTNRSIAFGMLDAFTQTGRPDSGTIGATVRAGIIGSPINGWKTSLTIGKRAYFNGSQFSDRLIRWENRFGTHRDWDLRISYEEQAARELQLAFSIYW